jgi:hypothetical protein
MRPPFHGNKEFSATWLNDLPSKKLADLLALSYFQSFQQMFPIIRERLFLRQYESLWGDCIAKPGNKWLAILNLVLAISCTRLQRIQDETSSYWDDELFFSRAQILIRSRVTTHQHADLQQVQLEALIALYYTVSMQMTR